MSFFNFRNQNKFKAIAQILSHNEQVSKRSLHEKHPHTRDIFARHNIDLQQIRRQSVKAATAATILGAFLAFPHLLGHPANETKNEPDLKTLNIEKQVEHPSNPTRTAQVNLTPASQTNLASASIAQPAVKHFDKSHKDRSWHDGDEEKGKNNDNDGPDNDYNKEREDHDGNRNKHQRNDNESNHHEGDNDRGQENERGDDE